MSQESMKVAIQAIIAEMMDRLIDRVTHEDSFNKETFQKEKPLYTALVPEEIFKGSHFERRFVTQFGGIWEKLAVVVAHEMLGFSARDYRIDGLVKSERLKRINELLSRLEHRESSIHSHHKPDWQQELAYILAGEGIDESVRVVCDVYMVNQQTGERWAFELKSPYPNSDITKVSKEKLLKLYSMDPPQVEGAFFALPYNPYGQRAKYNWSFPSRWFNMKTDLVVLMGDEFWDKIGGLGTYQAFIEAVNEIGKGYKDQIYRDYLGIEPPTRTQTETSQ